MQIASYNSHGDVKCSTWNTVSNIAIITYDARWVTDVLGESSHISNHYDVYRKLIQYYMATVIEKHNFKMGQKGSNGKTKIQYC